MKNQNNFSFVDLFSGIGGFRIPLEKLGGSCLGFSEIDNNAISTYTTNFHFCNNLGSVKNITKLPFSVDLITGGIPCQSWSIAGSNKGFKDERGELWFDAFRILELNKPKAFIFENVKGLVDPRNKDSFDIIISELEKLYNVSYSLLNSKNFGLIQNRERIYIIGIRKDLNIKFIFNKYTCLEHNTDFFIFSDIRNGATTIHSWDLIETTEREKTICITLLKNRRKNIYGDSDGNPLSFYQLMELIPDLEESELLILINKGILKKIHERYEFINTKISSGINDIYRIFLPSSKHFPTLTATGSKDFIALKDIDMNKDIFIQEIYNKNLFRSLTVDDYMKFQGFPNDFIPHSSDKTAMKQFGNAVSVPVVYELGNELIKTGIFE